MELPWEVSFPLKTPVKKKLLIDYLKQQVWNTLQGWKHKFFSVGGKEVLIKAVAQTIPVYTITSFQLPLSICKEINSMCAIFWWVSKDGNRKIYSKSWEFLSGR